MFVYAFKQTQFQLIKGVKLMSSTEVCLFVSDTMNYQNVVPRDFVLLTWSHSYFITENFLTVGIDESGGLTG